jgi:FdhD protein
LIDPVHIARRQIWRENGGFSTGSRAIPEETAIALSYDGGTYAVMMGTPRDLEDFAIGFSLSEGVIATGDDIVSLDIVELDDGIDIRMWLEPSRATRLSERRRHIAGPTGCGLCGIDSIAEAVRPAAIVGHGLHVLPHARHGFRY